MKSTSHGARRLLIIDDDPMSCEVLELFASEAGFEVTSADSGASALALLAAAADKPDVILTDMQMPGLSGNALARRLREAAKPSTRVLAMSGTEPAAARTADFECFLKKPFTMDDMEAALEALDRGGETPATRRNAPGKARPGAQPALGEVLQLDTYNSLAASLPAAQLAQLYAMSLDDADARVATMRRAIQARDDDAYRRAAHSIKGGCGMVGAKQLAAMAGAMETTGLPPVGDEASLDRFLAASAHLRRMLNANSV